MGSKFSRNLFKNLLLLLVTLTVLFIFMEIALRVIIHNPYSHSRSDHILWIRRHNPGLTLKLNRRAIDSEHPYIKFEVDERSYIKPSKRFSDPDCNIVFIGGSTTECLAVADTLRFHNIVSAELEKMGIRTNALNIGHEGNTMQDAINILMNHAILDSPNYVVLMHACNDVGLLRSHPDYTSRMGWDVNHKDLQRWTSQILSEKLYVVGFFRQRIDYALRIMAHNEGQHQKHLEKIAELECPSKADAGDQCRCNKYRARLESFIDICHNFGITPVMMTQPITSFNSESSPPWTEENLQFKFNQIIRAVSSEKKVVLIDLASYIYNEIPDFNIPNVLFYDLVHVNDKGSVVYGKYIASQLYKELSSTIPENLTN